MTRLPGIKTIGVKVQTVVRGGAILANHKSAMKRNRQNKTRNARNNVCRTQVKTASKKTLAEVKGNDQKAALQTLKQAERTIAKVASKGVIHKRTASRKISQLAKRVHQMASGT